MKKDNQRDSAGFAVGALIVCLFVLFMLGASGCGTISGFAHDLGTASRAVQGWMTDDAPVRGADLPD